jgi:hypothetical protein
LLLPDVSTRGTHGSSEAFETIAPITDTFTRQFYNDGIRYKHC